MSLFRALYPPGASAGHGQPIGFISLGTRTDALLANAGLDPRNGTRLRVTDRGALVFGPAAPLDAPRPTGRGERPRWHEGLRANVGTSYIGRPQRSATSRRLVARRGRGSRASLPGPYPATFWHQSR